jgi:hypothetical protein
MHCFSPIGQPHNRQSAQLGRSTKSQAPEQQAPNSKHQIPNKFKTTKGKRPNALIAASPPDFRSLLFPRL